MYNSCHFFVPTCTVVTRRKRSVSLARSRGGWRSGAGGAVRAEPRPRLPLAASRETGACSRTGRWRAARHLIPSCSRRAVREHPSPAPAPTPPPARPRTPEPAAAGPAARARGQAVPRGSLVRPVSASTSSARAKVRLLRTAVRSRQALAVFSGAGRACLRPQCLPRQTAVLRRWWHSQPSADTWCG